MTDSSRGFTGLAAPAGVAGVMGENRPLLWALFVFCIEASSSKSSYSSYSSSIAVIEMSLNIVFSLPPNAVPRFTDLEPVPSALAVFMKLPYILRATFLFSLI